jgi:hypothetical protein
VGLVGFFVGATVARDVVAIVGAFVGAVVGASVCIVSSVLETLVIMVLGAAVLSTVELISVSDAINLSILSKVIQDKVIEITSITMMIIIPEIIVSSLSLFKM